MTLVPDNLAELDFAPPSWDWRPHQLDIARRIEATTKKIVFLELEPGSGKSVIPSAVAQALGKKTAILVQTRQLERQYLRDFESLKMMEGRRNFPCSVNGQQADTGPCTVGYKCPESGKWDYATNAPAEWPNCPYYVKKFEARTAQLSVHNYSYWLREIRSQFSAFSGMDWIICDEAHELDQILMGAGEVRLNKAALKTCKIGDVPNSRNDLTAWSQWSVRKVEALALLIADLKDMAESEGIALAGSDASENGAPDFMPSVRGMDILNRLRIALDLVGDLETLAGLTEAEIDTDWVTAHESSHYIFKPIYGKYAFRRVVAAAKEKVILMSAFLAPDMLADTLGLDKSDYEVIIGGKIYDRTNSPILYCPVVRMNAKTSEPAWDFVVGVLDQILDEFPGEKGLIHIPSYHLRNRILAGSKHPERFITYGKPGELTKDEALLKFTNVEGDFVLLGQSISTGVDLPYTPKFNIIVKLAFPSTQDPAVKKRMKVDKQFLSFRTICETVQATGRIKRAPDDGGPTIILDATFDSWFWAANKKHFPEWFRDNLRKQGWSTFPDIQKGLKREAFKHRVIL